MKIAIFTDTFLPQMNGVVRSILNTTSRLEKSGYSFCVFAPGRKASKEHGFCGFRSFPFPTYPEFKIALPSKKLLLAHSNGISLVHSRGLFSAGYMAKYLSRKKHVPLIGTFDTPIQHYVSYFPVLGSLPILNMKLAAEKYTARYFNMCTAVIAPSETAKEILIRLGCRKRIELVTNGVDTKRFSPEASGSSIRSRLCKKDESLLLYVGRIAEEKRIDVLLNAMKELKEEKVKLAIVGKGPNKPRLESMARNLGNVIFTGPASEQELPGYYAACDIFVSASPVETEGLTFLEAMSTGKPIIGPEAGAASEIIRAGLNGEGFHPGDAKGLSEAINLVLKGDIRRMGKRSLKIAREIYSMETAAEKTRKIYDELGS